MHLSTSRKIGAGLATVHLVAFVSFVVCLHLSTEGQARLLWALWLPLDFPLSIFLVVGFDLIPPDSHFGRLATTLLPYFLHGVLGTIWWFYIPAVVSGIFNKLISPRRMR
jgi:hypothetical protein